MASLDWKIFHISEGESNADNCGVSAGDVVFETIAFTAKEELPGAAADARFELPIRSFVSD